MQCITNRSVGWLVGWLARMEIYEIYNVLVPVCIYSITILQSNKLDAHIGIYNDLNVSGAE